MARDTISAAPGGVVAPTSQPVTGTQPAAGAVATARKRKRVSIGRIALYTILTITALVWLIPLVTSIYTAIRTFGDTTQYGPWSFPPHAITLANFSQAWVQGGFSQYFLNTFLVVIPSIVLMLLGSSMTAYVLARHEFRGRKFLYITYVAGMLLPYQVLIIPVYWLSNELNIYDTPMALIAIFTTFEFGFCTFVLYGFMRGIPKELTDAAFVDGASAFQVWWRIILPLCRPALATLATLEFTWKWNDYLWPITLISDSRWFTVTAGLGQLQGEFVNNWNEITAGALLVAIPTLIVYVALQRYFIGGLLVGSNK